MPDLLLRSTIRKLKKKKKTSYDLLYLVKKKKKKKKKKETRQSFIVCFHHETYDQHIYNRPPVPLRYAKVHYTWPVFLISTKRPI